MSVTITDREAFSAATVTVDVRMVRTFRVWFGLVLLRWAVRLLGCRLDIHH